MASRSVDEHDLSQIVLRREEALRHYFPTSLVPRETIGDSLRSKQTWDHVLDPPQPQQPNRHSYQSRSGGKFKKLEFLVEGLFRNSSQLDHQELKHEFFSEYPVPLAPTLATEKTMEAWRVKELTEGRYGYDSTSRVCKLYNSYVPEVDLNRLASELECFRQGEASARDEKQHDAAVNITESTAKEPASNETVVPSLASLAQAAVAKKTIQDSLLLEQHFSARLDELRSSARQSIKETVSQGQSKLEDSAEAKKVQELRQQLAQAEQALHDLEEKICTECQVEVDKIQRTYDQDRANAAADYMKERDALIQRQTETISHEGMAFCSGCAVPFLPRRHSDIVLRDRCSVQGCQSGEFYCLDCASSRCAQCCAPVCLAHTTFHQFTCKQESPEKCGYSKEQDSLEMGLANGCCGRDMGYVHSSDHCKVCGVVVCSACEYRDEPMYPPDYDPEMYMDYDMRHLAPEPKKPYCPGCAPVKSARRDAGEPERKRMRETSKHDEFMTPVERVVMSTRKWEREQEELHEKWVQNRLEAMTKDEYDYVTDWIYSDMMGERRADKFEREVKDVSSFILWLNGWDGSGYKERTLKMLVDRDTDSGDTAKFCPCGQCKLEARKQKAVDTSAN